MGEEKKELTPEEELKAYFQKHDLTAGMTLGHVPNVADHGAKTYNRVKNLFRQYWRGNLPGLGVNRPMKNFSPYHPVNLLEDAEGTMFAEQIAAIFGNPEEFSVYIDRFFEMYEEPVITGFFAYCKSAGKEPDDLTDDEIMMILDKVVDVINEEQTKAIMVGQQVPELFGVTKEHYSHEDFNKSIKKNQDRQNFVTRWTHADTKLGAPLSLEELQEKDLLEGTDYVAEGRGFFDEPLSVDRAECSEELYIELRDSFAETLEDVDRQIFLLSEKGLTQKEIAAKLGFKTHSAVTKRKEKLKPRFMAFIEQYNREHSDDSIYFERMIENHFSA